MKFQEDQLPCSNCGRLYPADELDRQRWCKSCRAIVVRRATYWAVGAGLVAAAVTLAWVIQGIGRSPTFPLVLWMVMIVAVFYFVYKIVRRVGFEIIRSRGVPPAEE